MPIDIRHNDTTSPVLRLLDHLNFICMAGCVVSNDCKRFLMITQPESTPSPNTLMLNWKGYDQTTPR